MAVIEPLLKHIATTGLVTALTVAFVCFVAARFWLNIKNQGKRSSAVRSLEKALENHREKVKRNFESFPSPYRMDDEKFVDIFDLSHGENKKELPNEQDGRTQQLFGIIKKHGCLFIEGTFGMGKSTIARHLFVHSRKYEASIFINFHDKEVPDVQASGSLIEWIFQNSEKMVRCARDKIIIQMAEEKLDEKKVLLIFDALDENKASQESSAEIKKFFKLLEELKWPSVVTCREEIGYFRDYIPKLIKYNGFDEACYIQLKPWQEKQWQCYFDHLETSAKNEDAQKKVEQFKTAFYGGTYSVNGNALRERPLFLAMLSGLVLGDPKETSRLKKGLESNLGEIYFKYIHFTIRNDLERKSRGLNEASANETELSSEPFDKWMETLEEAACKMYCGMEVVWDDLEKIGKRKGIAPEHVKSYLGQTGAIGVLMRSRPLEFAHQSFMEYLVAHRLAAGFFNGDEESELSDAWSYFQTHEVYYHFKGADKSGGEIVRKAYSKEAISDPTLSALYGNAKITNAFKEFLDEASLEGLKYERGSQGGNKSEKVEQVLYYAGVFRLKGLSERLMELLENSEHLDPTFYRTISQSLSMMEEKTKFCSDYVLNVADKVLKGDFSLFENNLDIQRAYYGSSPDDIRGKLEEHIESYKINEVPSDDIFPLRLFTYFTVAPLSEHDRKKLNELKRVKNNQEIMGVVDKTFAVIESGKIAKYWAQA